MLTELPTEIVEFIFKDSCLSHVDICQLEQCCWLLRRICKSNEVWKKKFKDKWPELVNDVLETNVACWKEWYRRRTVCRHIVRTEIKGMSALYYKKDELSREAFDAIEAQMEEHCLGSKFVLNELLGIVNDSNRHTCLTLKYYAKKVLTFVRHTLLQARWQNYFKSPVQEQCLENGMIMAAQWFQPTETIDPKDISNQLDEIARITQERLVHWKPRIDQEWTRSRRILIALNSVLFGDMLFTIDLESYYETERSFIDKVLKTKTGNPLTLCLMYLCIAKRLGVNCEPVGFPGHFLLRWNQQDKPMTSDGQYYTYIDVFNGGKFMQYEDLRRLTKPSEPLQSWMTVAIPPIKVFQRVARNLINAGHRRGNAGDGMRYLRYGLELLLIMFPEDIDSRLLLVRMYLHLNINLTEVLSSLQEIQQRDPTQSGIVAYMYQICHSLMRGTTPLESEEVELQLRGSDSKVAYAVGMIMRHKMYGYSCAIYGWDPVCTASREWKTQMGVDRLPQKDHQPFYNVLVCDGSIRYAAQENLELHPDPQYIDHPEIGHYFAEFRYNHFVPNDEKVKEYPDDEALRISLLTEMYPWNPAS